MSGGGSSSNRSLLGRSNHYIDNSSPSMVQRTGDSLVVRSVVSGTSLNIPGFEEPDNADLEDDDDEDDLDDDAASPENLPQCKIKRNYTCTHCSFFTQNPRTYLYHLRDEHKEKIRVYECPKCVYASKHSQKLQRHIHMVHVIGKQNEKLSKKLPPLNSKLPPPPPLVRAGHSSEMSHDEQDGESDDEGLVMNVEGDQDMEEMEDCEDEDEEDEMMLDNSTLNSSTEVDPEGGTSTEEVKCSLCPFTSHSKILVQRHENITHLKKKFFRCTKCNYVTHMKARFTKHVKYHSMPMIKCDLCDFRTPYKWNLDRHYKNHQGDGEFKCPHCNFTADIKQSLTVHVQNHHLTPQQRLMRGMGRRNKVGASDAPAKELRMADVGLVGAGPSRTPPPPPLLLPSEVNNGYDDDEMEYEESMANDEENFQVSAYEISANASKGPPVLASTSRASPPRRHPKLKVTLKKGKAGSSSAQEQNERHHFESDFIHPDDILHKNGKIYYKNLKCNYCSYRAFWEGDIMRHESKIHGIESPRNVKPVKTNAPKKMAPRPIPNLIPLQQQTSPPPTASILRIPSVPASRRSSESSHTTETPAMTDQEVNDLCSKSSNSALKDFASLIGEAFPGDDLSEGAAAPTETKEKEECKQEEEIVPTDDKKESKEKVPSPVTPPQVASTKRKTTTSFFDKLKEKLIGTEASNLVCERCGHESKCLSEAVCHQKIHKDEEQSSCSNQRSISSMVKVSSTRCQHCRHRCKTSSDLLVHLQSCLSRDSTSDGQGEDEAMEEEKEKVEEEEPEPPECQNCEQRFDTEEDLSKHLDYCKPKMELNPEVSITEVKPQELHPMENKVFVWNQFSTEPSKEEIKPALTIERISSTPRAPTTSQRKNVDDYDDEDDDDEGGVSMIGFETAPGFGSVTCHSGHSVLKPNTEASHVQRVFKCPKCNFWASAASRFHIHLVGHLNHKPFGCSQCDYRSNWRWDVAKHIRLKGVRDPLHAVQSRPRVLVHDDDSSRRNYSKYNKFLTLMNVRLGQTQSDSPPPANLPAPPRLIPAPSVSDPNGTRQQPLRPPPPLRAATQHTLSQLANSEESRQGIKRPFGEGTSSQSNGASKPLEPGTKRLLWRCKKCNYRGLNKDEVLAHVRTHYQTTQFLHTPQAGSSDQKYLKCDKCPFIGQSVSELNSHKQHHVSQPGAIFKCYLCPFYVTTKRELLTHMHIHGVNEPEDHLSKTMQAKMAANKQATADNEEDGASENGYGANKRYKCTFCPYETNARSQYMYHQQLHGSYAGDDAVKCSNPDGSEGFKCHVCSYTVVKRHLLHQHLRVHGIVVPSSRVTSTTSITPAPPLLPPIDVSNHKDVPLVWVMKNNKYLKMFKCRSCPHVNLRKVNIQEHEKMHKLRKNSNGGMPSPATDPSGMIHRCTQCSYQCNNAGVLSAHAKVHQDWYPRSCAVVDVHRSDEVQLKELGGEMAETSEMDDADLDQMEGGILGGTFPDVITITPQLSITRTDNKSTINDRQEELHEGEEDDQDTRLIYFCRHCPARFLFSRELAIHRRFHRIRLQHHCPSCNYTARQPSHLQAHAKVHTQEYQDRTQLLLQQHRMSHEYYRPTAVYQDGVWVVIEEAQPVLPPQPQIFAVKQFACTKCPATFFKSVALSYHLTLHGGPGPYKCKNCDYSVKMYGNLVRHELVHAAESKPGRAGMSITNSVDFIPLSGTDLFKHREARKLDEPSYTKPAQSLPVDPVFGTLMHGNPKFIYPTYLKNGKMKEKRYKCHKCPSAFEKREQYKVHLSLHGSKQKYRCERCDYSVKYYANFIQHIRKHKHNDEARQAAGEDASEDETTQNKQEESSSIVRTYPQKTAGKSISSSQSMLTADRQHLMIQQRRKAADEDSLKDEQISIVPSYWCPHCPYNSMRRDGVETHSKRHICNNPGIKTNFLCQHCDYSAPQSHFLREHNRLHFRWKPQPPGRRPETYMQYDEVELWSHPLDKENETSDVKSQLVFQDKGPDTKDEAERFFPLLENSDNEDGEIDFDVIIDLRTGEIVSEESNRLKSEPKDDTEKIETPVTETPQEDSGSEMSNEDAQESV